MDLFVNTKDFANCCKGLLAPFIFFIPYYANEIFTLAPLLFTIIIWVILSDINHVLHLHVHCPFCKNRTMNCVLDYAMGLVTGMTASNWRMQHVHGHHNPQVGDYADMLAWERRRYTMLGGLCYSTRTILPIFLRPLTESYNKGIRDNIVLPINYRYAFLEQCAVLAIVGVLTSINPQLTLSYLLPWYALVYFVTRYTDYLNHVGCDDSQYGHSNNSLNSHYNKSQRNFGYHTAHHHAPSAHWTQLPVIHDKMKHKIPVEHLKPYSWSGYMLPYHWYLSWRNRM